MNRTRITILGAGLVGSLLAIYLARRGYQVDIYERRGDMRREPIAGGRSINLALSERGWRGLAGVGLDATVRRMALPMTARIVHQPDGSLSRQPYGHPDQAIYSISRAELNKLLMNQAEATGRVQIHFRHFCARVDLHRCRIQFSSGPDDEQLLDTQPFSVLIGADGAYSALRCALQFTDQFNLEQIYIDHNYKELHMPPSATGDWQLDPTGLHIWPRKNFMLIALPNPDKSFTCTLFLQAQGPESFATLTDKSRVADFFLHYFPDAYALMPNCVDDFFNHPTGTLMYVKCYPWSYQRTCLIGDAAHAIVPFFGQGMNCGFEDCTVLDRLLDEHPDDWENVFERFQQQRKKHTDAICTMALNNFVEMRDLVADPHFLHKKKIELMIAQRYPKDFVSPYQMVSFTHIPYADALEKGRRIDAVLEQLAALPDLDQQFENETVQQLIRSVLFGSEAG